MSERDQPLRGGQHRFVADLAAVALQQLAQLGKRRRSLTLAGQAQGS